MAKKRKKRWNKGGAYEREVCRLLSEWWSGGREDDLFWRTHGSGARATVRSKKGKSTAGQYGDICALDGRGRLFTKICCVSLKRGYQKDAIVDMLDSPPISGEPLFSEWVRDCIRDTEAAGALGWIMFVRRNRKVPIIFMSQDFFDLCASINPSLKKSNPILKLKAKYYSQRKYKINELRVLFRKKKKPKMKTAKIVGIHMKPFLAAMKKKQFKKLWERYGRASKR